MCRFGSKICQDGASRFLLSIIFFSCWQFVRFPRLVRPTTRNTAAAHRHLGFTLPLCVMLEENGHCVNNACWPARPWLTIIQHCRRWTCWQVSLLEWSHSRCRLLSCVCVCVCVCVCGPFPVAASSSLSPTVRILILSVTSLQPWCLVSS